MQGEGRTHRYEIARGDARGLADVREFVETLSALERHPVPELRTLFDPRARNSSSPARPAGST